MIGHSVQQNKRQTRFEAAKVVIVAIAFAVSAPVLAQNPQQTTTSSQAQPTTDLRKYVPSTVSEGWRKVIEDFPDPTKAPRMPASNDVEGWKKMFDASEQRVIPLSETAVKQLDVNVTSKELGGVPVLEVTPKGWVDNGKLLIHTHGGAYTLFSARSTVYSGALVATRTGLRVISVDYTNPPRALAGSHRSGGQRVQGTERARLRDEGSRHLR